MTSAASTTPVPARSGLRANIRCTPAVRSSASVTSPARSSSTARRSLSTEASLGAWLDVLETDLAEHLGGRAGRDHSGGQILRHDRVRADHTPVPDLDAAGHDAADAKPAVRANPDRPAELEALPGDRLRRIVVAVIGIANEAVVGEHHVVADLDQLGRSEHRVSVQEAPPPDRDPGFRGEGQPATRLKQGVLPDFEPSRVEGLQQLAFNRVTDDEATLGGVTIHAQASPPAPVALIPAPLHPPGAPLAERSHAQSLSEAASKVPAMSPGSEQAPRGGIDLGGTKIQTVVVDAKNEVLGESRRPTPEKGGPKDVAGEMAAALREAAERAGLGTTDLAGVGVGSPGDADEKTGVVSGARNLP